MTLFPASMRREKDHPEYSRLATSKFPTERARIDGLWARYSRYADPDFADEFRRDPEARLWEMVLHCALEDSGHSVTPSFPGPDSKIETDRGPVWFEAVAPTAGADTSKDCVPPELIGSSQAKIVPENAVILRFTSAIADKKKIYDGYLQRGTVAATDPFVIAVNGCRVPFAGVPDNPPGIVRAVFPLGREKLVIEESTGKLLYYGRPYDPVIPKASGAPVPTNFFMNPVNAGVSAVLFSTIGPRSWPRRLWDDFVWVLNPLATSPVPASLTCLGEVWHATDSGADWVISSYQCRTR